MVKYLVVATVLLCFWAGALKYGSRTRPAKTVAVAAPQPTEEPRHPAPASQWTVSENGLGPVQIGLKASDVALALGEYFGRQRHAQYDCGYADWPSQPDGVAVDISGGTVERIVVESGAVRTNAGIGIGDDAQRVVDMYTSMSESIDTVGSALRVNFRRATDDATPRGIKFELDGKRRVLSYVAGYRYQLDDKTSCP